MVNEESGSLLTDALTLEEMLHMSLDEWRRYEDLYNARREAWIQAGIALGGTREDMDRYEQMIPFIAEKAVRADIDPDTVVKAVRAYVLEQLRTGAPIFPGADDAIAAWSVRLRGRYRRVHDALTAWGKPRERRP